MRSIAAVARPSMPIDTVPVRQPNAAISTVRMAGITILPKSPEIVGCETAAEKKRLELWKADNAEILGYARKRQLELWAEGGDDSEDEDIVPQEMLDDVERLATVENMMLPR
jgi:hypothetical protein